MYTYLKPKTEEEILHNIKIIDTPDLSLQIYLRGDSTEYKFSQTIVAQALLKEYKRRTGEDWTYEGHISWLHFKKYR